MAVDQPQFIAIDRGIALRDRALAGAKRLHLGALEFDSGFKPLLDEIFVTRAPVLGDDLGLVEFVDEWFAHGRQINPA